MSYEYEFINHFEGTGLKTFLVSIHQRPFHWHYDIELIWVLEGAVEVKTGDQTYSLSENDLFLLNRYELHSLQRTKQPNTLLAIQFSPKFCKSYYPALQTMRFTDKKMTQLQNPQAWTQISSTLRDILTQCIEHQSGFAFKVVSSLNLLVHTLLTKICYTHTSEARLLAEEKNLLRLSRIIEYIQDNFASKISLKDIARQENLDMTYLSHFIKKHLGISFQQYVNKVRLSKAIDLMTKTNMKKIDICMECGFSDYRYLSRLFHQEFGCTPSQYHSRYPQLQPVLHMQDHTGQHRIIGEKEALKRILNCCSHTVSAN